MVVDCSLDPKGADELLCLIQDPFKAAVSQIASSHAVFSLTTLPVCSYRLLGILGNLCWCDDSDHIDLLLTSAPPFRRLRA